jgi:PAS domain S-box-containing protein
MTGPGPAGSPPHNVSSDDFLPERVALLYRFAHQDIVALAFATGVTAFALWGYVEVRLLGLWLVWMVLACTVRVVLHRVHSRFNPPPEAARLWESWFSGAGALLGAGWGVCILLAFPSKGDLYQILVPSMICTLALGMPSALAPSPKAFTALLVPILAPLIALLFTNGGFNTSAAMLLLVFTGVLLALYLGANRTLMETLRFGRENIELAEKLHEADRSLAAALSELRVIFDSAAVGLASIRDHRIARHNEAFAHIFGHASGEMTGQSTRIMHRSDTEWAEAGAAADRRFAEGQSSVAEHELVRKDGQTFWGTVEARALDLRDPDAGVILAVHDITPRKRAEQELLASLQREKELNELKSRFVSTVSHEFRTPLSTILSSAELLRLYPDKLEDNEKLNLLTGIEDATKRMRRLLDEVLTLGRAESGVLKLRPTQIALSELCAKVVHDLCIGEGKQHTIVFEDRFDRETVELDESLLRHILNNLLANAIKYSAPGTTVRLTLEHVEGNVRLTVEDSGIGIPAEDQPRLFESFHRASNVQNRQGTGLGLAIVKKSVELHGGSIAFDTKVGVGTRFCVTLPLQVRAPAAVAA